VGAYFGWNDSGVRNQSGIVAAEGTRRRSGTFGKAAVLRGGGDAGSDPSDLHFIKRPISYRDVNTIHLSYKNQSVNIVQ
jgi:hypothetical protein